MDVKGAQSFTTYFFPIGSDILQMFLDYVDHVRGEPGWSDGHFLFPRAKQEGGSFRVQGLGDDRWKTPGPVWDTFRRAFARVQLPYFSPHSFRRMLVQPSARVAESLSS